MRSSVSAWILACLVSGCTALEVAAPSPYVASEKFVVDPGTIVTLGSGSALVKVTGGSLVTLGGILVLPVASVALSGYLGWVAMRNINAFRVYEEAHAASRYAISQLAQAGSSRYARVFDSSGTWPEEVFFTYVVTGQHNSSGDPILFGNKTEEEIRRLFEQAFTIQCMNRRLVDSTDFDRPFSSGVDSIEEQNIIRECSAVRAVFDDTTPNDFFGLWQQARQQVTFALLETACTLLDDVELSRASAESIRMLYDLENKSHAEMCSDIADLIEAIRAKQADTSEFPLYGGRIDGPDDAWKCIAELRTIYELLDCST